MSKLLTREAILGTLDLEREEVEVPEWGGKVLIQTMDGASRDHMDMKVYEDMAAGEAGTENFRARLLAYTIVDRDGNRLFSYNDIAALGKKSSSALRRCYDVAKRLNRITDEDVEEAKQNLSPTPDGASTSG